MRNIRLLGLLVVPVVLVGICGSGCGSGGDDPATEARFVGSYWMYELYGYARYTPNSGGYFNTAWGTAEVDGMGEIVTDLHWATGYEFESPPVTYSIRDDDHAIQCALGAYRWEGGVSPYAQCMVAGEVGEWRDPRLVILLRHGGAFNTASLAGTYRLVGFQHETFYSGTSICDALVTFDGAGGYSVPSYGVKRFGAPLQDRTPEDGLTYTLGERGELTLDSLQKSIVLSGGVLSGGSVALAAGGNGESFSGVFYALIETATYRTDANFDGDYWTVGLARGTEGFRSFTGFIRADGAGGYRFWGTQNAEGAIETIGPDAGTYAVEPDGRLTLTTGEGATLLGALNLTSRYFVLGGATDYEDEAYIVFGVRK